MRNNMGKMLTPSASPARFSLPVAVALPEAFRLLGSGEHWGFVLAAFKDHGPHPEVWRSRLDVFACNVVLQGEARYREQGGEEQVLGPGRFFQRRPGLAVTTRYSPHYIEFFVVLDPRTTPRLLVLGLLPNRRWGQVAPMPMALEQCRQLYATVARPAREQGRADLLLAVLNWLRDACAPKAVGAGESEGHGWVHEVCTLLEGDLRAELALPTLARDCGVSYATFRRQFAAVTGMSPGQYRLRSRLQRAAGLLTTRPVKQVAAQLGYSDAFTFSTQFKRTLGVTPRAYRARGAAARAR